MDFVSMYNLTGTVSSTILPSCHCPGQSWTGRINGDRGKVEGAQAMVDFELDWE